MARAFNLPTEAQRTSEVALFWVEISSGAGAASYEVPKHSAVRVRATAGTTVSFDGILSATMAASEIMVFNSGGVDLNSPTPPTKATKTLTVTGTCFIQVGQETLQDDP